MQYPTCREHCDQAQRETRKCVNSAEYVKYLPDLACSPGLCTGPVRREQGGGQAERRRLGFRVSIKHPFEPPAFCPPEVGGSPFPGVEGWYLPGRVILVGDI